VQRHGLLGDRGPQPLDLDPRETSSAACSRLTPGRPGTPPPGTACRRRLELVRMSTTEMPSKRKRRRLSPSEKYEIYVSVLTGQ
jgi:hypothetical protein